MARVEFCNPTSTAMVAWFLFLDAEKSRDVKSCRHGNQNIQCQGIGNDLQKFQGSYTPAPFPRKSTPE